MSLSAEFERLRVVLVSPRNPLNIGAAARAMSNFGFFHLRVVNPYAVAFREARSAVGAAKLLSAAEEYGTVAEAVADCRLVVGTTAVRHRELQHPLRGLPQAAPIIRRRLARDRVALLFGSEKFGLSNDDLTHCHWLIHVATHDAHISMNLGQAVAVCLYELARGARGVERPEKLRTASAGEMERVTVLLMDSLQKSGYVKPRHAAGTEAKIRRLVRRLQLPHDDAEVWFGILRQIAWKLRSPEGD